ncbi:hypothetical protein TKK_0001194 [Trichogramma kaykai]|uniref:Uncharacterized protein n=1 Tax=Trichogramma kaykai TaxID=54128 RepID=A0ABD2WXH0_9HYME
MWKMLKVALKFGTMNNSDSRCLLIEDVQTSGEYSQEISTQLSSPIKPRTTIVHQTETTTDSGIDSKLSSSLDHMSLERSESWDLTKTEDEPMVQEEEEEEEEVAEAAKIDTSVSEKPVVAKDFRCYYEQNCAGDTCLHRAILYGYKDVAMKIIDATIHPIYLDMKNCDAQTALHVAVMTRQVEIIKRLVQAGANTSLKDDNHNTALHLACMADDTECAVALLESLLPINIFNPTGIDQLNSVGKSWQRFFMRDK